MEGEQEGGGGGEGRADIDTSAPFRSVKEAVSLFGERVLAGEVYAGKLNQIRNAAAKNVPAGHLRIGSIVAELEEAKQNLEKAREERLLMANCLTSLKQELDRTKRELLQLKLKGSEKVVVDLEIKDVNFVEFNTAKIEAQPLSNKGEISPLEFQRKRSVRFANPPTSVMFEEEPAVEMQFSPSNESLSVKRKKKKVLMIPLIAGIFSRKKGNDNYQEGVSPKST